MEKILNIYKICTYIMITIMALLLLIFTDLPGYAVFNVFTVGIGTIELESLICATVSVLKDIIKFRKD